jgi:ankyrin repeat protein
MPTYKEETSTTRYWRPYDCYDQIVQQLLRAGADVNVQGGKYRNALQMALYEGHDHIVQRLLEARTDANAKGGHYRNALQAARHNAHGQIAYQPKSAIYLNNTARRPTTTIFACFKYSFFSASTRSAEGGNKTTLPHSPLLYSSI